MFLAKPGTLWRGTKRTLTPLESTRGALWSRLFRHLLGRLGRGRGLYNTGWDIRCEKRTWTLLLKSDSVLAKPSNRLGQLGVHG